MSPPGEINTAGETGAAAELERRYRWLLLAYPLDHRERRAEEMLATLLDDAAPGQRRPTWDEAADLVIGGARQRLRLPALPEAWVAAVLSALIVGAVVAAGAAAFGWMATGALPDNQTVTRLVTSAFAPQSGIVTTRRDEVFSYDAPAAPSDRVARVIFGGDTYTAGYVRVTGRPEDGYDLHDAAAMLRQSGWHVDPVRADAEGMVLTASKARLTLQARLGFTDGQLVVAIRRAVPFTVVPLTLFGWIGGAIAGWMFAGALARRAGRQHPVVATFMQAAIVFGLVFLTPVTALTTVALARLVIGSGSTWATPPWNAYMYPMLRPAALIGMVFAIVAAGLATVASPGERPARRAALGVAHGEPQRDHEFGS
jgi:hypothetical protein